MHLDQHHGIFTALIKYPTRGGARPGNSEPLPIRLADRYRWDSVLQDPELRDSAGWRCPAGGYFACLPTMDSSPTTSTRCPSEHAHDTLPTGQASSNLPHPDTATSQRT